MLQNTTYIRKQNCIVYWKKHQWVCSRVFCFSSSPLFSSFAKFLQFSFSGMKKSREGGTSNIECHLAPKANKDTFNEGEEKEDLTLHTRFCARMMMMLMIRMTLKEEEEGKAGYCPWYARGYNHHFLVPKKFSLSCVAQTSSYLCYREVAHSREMNR